MLRDLRDNHGIDVTYQTVEAVLRTWRESGRENVPDAKIFISRTIRRRRRQLEDARKGKKKSEEKKDDDNDSGGGGERLPIRSRTSI